MIKAFNEFLIDMELVEFYIFFLITGLVVTCSFALLYVFKSKQTKQLGNALIITFLFGLFFYLLFGFPIYIYMNSLTNKIPFITFSIAITILSCLTIDKLWSGLYHVFLITCFAYILSYGNLLSNIYAFNVVTMITIPLTLLIKFNF